jgi:hypothetical protein
VPPHASPGVRGQETKPSTNEQVHQAAARGIDTASTPLPHAATIQRLFGPANDVSHIQAHVGGGAAQACADMDASAYATGKHVAFAKSPDLHTAAHEAAHVVQQAQGVSLYGGVGATGDAYEQHADAVADRVVAGESAADLFTSGHKGSAPAVQRASIRRQNDTDPLHDPSRLSDADIEACDEYRAYMAMPATPPLRPVLPEEARLACRLLLRAMREHQPTVSGIYVYSPGVLDAELSHWLDIARSRLGTTATAEASVGTQTWVAASAGDVTTPASAASEFTRWMLGGGNQPDPVTGQLNCWEMVLFSAFRSGHLDETRMRAIYTQSRAAMTTGGPMAFPRTLERLLRSSSEYTYNPHDPSSPRPLRGDLVIFQEAANHVALATGRQINGPATGGSGPPPKVVEIVSHWPPPDGSYHVKTTTIEALLGQMQGVSVAKFWSPIW